MNVNTMSIYNTVDRYIVDKGYHSMDRAKKVNIVREGLLDYSVNIYKNNNLENSNLLDIGNDPLKCILNDLNTIVDDKEDFFRHYSHYLIILFSDISNSRTPLWWIKEDANLIEKPIFKYDENGDFSGFYSHVDTDPLQVTLFLLEQFDTLAFKDNNVQKELIN